MTNSYCYWDTYFIQCYKWNRLPMELKLLRSTDMFRRDLKTFLFHSVSGHQDTSWVVDLKFSNCCTAIR